MICICNSEMDPACAVHKSYVDHPGLNPEQREVVRAWDAENQERFKFYNQLEAAEKAGDSKLMSELIEGWAESIPRHCEHGRDVWSGCMACDEIENIIYPDLVVD